MPRARPWCQLLLAAYCLLGRTAPAHAAQAQAQPHTEARTDRVMAAQARYPLPRFDEEWSRLRDEAQRDDAWDRVKWVPLGARDGRAAISFGGELRVTYERFEHPDFGQAPADPNGHWQQRYFAHADLRAGAGTRLFGSFVSGRMQGRVGGSRPVLDRNDGDLHELFVERSLSRGAADARARFVRVGRQEITVGSGRLLSLREGPNVPLSFDGLRVSARGAVWQMDAFALAPVLNRPGLFDDAPQRRSTLWGVYVARRRAPPTAVGGAAVGGAAVGSATVGSAAAAGVDAYYFGIDRLRSRFDEGVARERRHTIGLRFWRRGAWGYDVEAMYQSGAFGAGRIAAWRGVAEGSYTPSGAVALARWRPRVSLTADVSSGDRDRADGDLQTFNALYQSGTYSGRAQILGPANTIRIEPGLSVTPTPRVTVSGGWGFYWRQSIHDGLYGISGQLLVPSNGVPQRREGSRPMAQIDWQITRHLSAHLNYIHVFNGPFARASVGGTARMSYVSPWITYRF